MGLFSALFGSKPKVETKTLSTFTPEQTALFNYLTGVGKNAIENPANVDVPDYAPTKGQNVSLNTMELLSQKLAESGAGFGEAKTALEGVPSASSIYGDNPITAGTSSGSYLKSVFNESPTSFEDYFKTSVQDPALEQFQKSVLPGISRRQGLEGFTTSGRVQQDQFAQEALLKYLTQERSNLAFQTAESSANRRLEAATALGNQETSDLDRSLQAILGGASIKAGLAESDASLAVQKALGLGDLASNEIDTIANALGVQSTAANQEADIAQKNKELQVTAALQQQGLNQQQISMLISLLGIDQIENVVLNTPGSQGILGSALSAFAGAAGKSIGAGI